jgi:hypothetical protein
MKILQRASVPVLLASILISGCVAKSHAAGPEPLEEPIHVLILGDSISIGYTPIVQRLLAERAVVVRPTNEKGNPENCAGTNNGVQKIDRWLALDGGAWDVIHFNFGLHDLKRVNAETSKNSNDPADPHQASPERYEEQLTGIVAKLKATGARLVWAMTTPVPDGGVRPHRAPDDVVLYNCLALQVMADNRVEIDDLYELVLPRLEELQKPVDVHFTAEGNEALGEQVVGSILQVAGLPR